MSTQALQRLSPKHEQIARLLVAGHNQSEIAKLMDMHKSTVSRLVRDPLVAQEIERLKGLADRNTGTPAPGISSMVQDGAQLGVETLVEILKDQRNDADILKIKANVALELLSRAGFGEIKQIQTASVHMNTPYFTKEEIEDIKARAKKIKEEEKMKNEYITMSGK